MVQDSSVKQALITLHQRHQEDVSLDVRFLTTEVLQHPHLLDGLSADGGWKESAQLEAHPFLFRERSGLVERRSVQKLEADRPVCILH